MEGVLEDQKKLPELPESSIKIIFEYVHKDFNLIIQKNKNNNKKLSIDIIMSGSLEDYFSDILKGFKFKDILCEKATERGYLSTLKWAKNNGFEFYSKTFKNAAKNGHLNCLKFLRESGCEWKTEICSTAALNGHLHCLQWARENGCPWNCETIENAIYYNHENCLDYARYNGCPEPDFLYS